MNDTDTLQRHMLDIRELTAEAFAPYGQVVAPLRTGGQDAETAENTWSQDTPELTPRGMA